MKSRYAIALVLALALAARLAGVRAQPNSPTPPAAATETPVKPVFPLPVDPKWKKLLPSTNVWIDHEGKRVIFDAEVCLREGFLEMFACLKRTKEHESLIAVDSKAQVIHAALLAIGAVPGKPVQFRPEFKPPSGTEVEITIEWLDADGKKKTARAQDWILDVAKQKAMGLPFVFAGSGFWEDEQTKQRHYQAESGDFICVANFPSAMLDVPAQSSESDATLNFKAFTEHIPPVDTKVRVFLTPKLEKKDARGATRESAPPARGRGATGERGR